MYLSRWLLLAISKNNSMQSETYIPLSPQQSVLRTTLTTLCNSIKTCLRLHSTMPIHAVQSHSGFLNDIHKSFLKTGFHIPAEQFFTTSRSDEAAVACSAALFILRGEFYIPFTSPFSSAERMPLWRLHAKPLQWSGVPTSFWARCGRGRSETGSGVTRSSACNSTSIFTIY